MLSSPSTLTEIYWIPKSKMKKDKDSKCLNPNFPLEI